MTYITAKTKVDYLIMWIGQVDISGLSADVEAAAVPRSVSRRHRRGLWFFRRQSSFLKTQKTRLSVRWGHWRIGWCRSLRCATLFEGGYSSSVRAGYGDQLPMVGRRPEELTRVKLCGLGWAGLWSGREGHVQRLRQGRESQALERATHCGESGGRQWEEQTLKKERGVFRWRSSLLYTLTL